MAMASERRLLLIPALVLVIVIPASLLAADDAEWRERTGADPGRGPAAAPGKVDPAAVPGLVLWLDASQGVTADAGGKVSAWADRSPRKQDLAQADPAWQPLRLEGALGGLPAVRFTGEQNAAQTLLCEKFTLAGSPGFTAIALVKQNREVYSSTLLHYGPDNMQRGAHVALNALAAAVGPTRDFAMTVMSAASLPGTGFRCLALVADNAAGAQELWVDGARVARAVQTFALEPEGRFVLGGHRPGAGNCHGGACADVAEVLVFSRALAAEERQGLEKYLNTKWGLAGRRGAVTALAARLPFAYYPSTGEAELAFDKSADLLQEHLGGVFRPAADTTALKPETLKPGLTWATYDGKKLPDDLAKATPTATGTAGDLDLPGGRFDPKEGTPYVLAGWLDVPQAAPYTFVLCPQTASRLWIGGRLIADVSDSKGSWGTWNWRGDAVALAAGRHRIVLAGLAQHRPVEHTGQPMVLWSGPGFWRRQIPAGKLAHSEPEALVLPAAEKPDARSLPKALAKIGEVPFAVVDVRKEKEVASGTLKVDASGRGQGRFAVGSLAEGEYAVEYQIAGTKVRLPQTFTRARFPWEKNTLGTGHEVYPPFVPVKVDGAQVSVVDRAYRIGAFGTFDSLVSQGRELLAAPMAVIAKVGGTEVAWKPGKVKGKATQPDLAEFSASASSDALTIEATTQVEEDGCARIEWTYGPKGKPVTVDWLELVIPLKEAEAPLFGWSASDSMRHHYWGEVPPAGNTTWDTEQGKAPGWVPAAWQKAEGPAPADGRVWDSTRNLHWTHGNFDPFVAYVWLGAEERGLAWFADRPGQFVGRRGAAAPGRVPRAGAGRPAGPRDPAADAPRRAAQAPLRPPGQPHQAPAARLADPRRPRGRGPVGRLLGRLLVLLEVPGQP